MQKTRRALSALVMLPALAASAERTTVTWDEVKNAIGDTICLRDEPRAPSGYRMSWGKRESCTLEAPATPLQRSVDLAFVEAAPLMVTVKGVFSVLPPSLERALAAVPRADPQFLSDAGALLEHEPFLRALMPRVVAVLEREGMTCEGCPRFEPFPLRRLTWQEFSPYVSAFILPHPDAAGFHICSGTDAAKHVADRPDPDLLRAGFLTASQSAATRKRAGEALQALRNDAAFLDSSDNAARVAALHQEVVRRFRSDTEIRDQACEALDSYGQDLGVSITDCGSDGSAPLDAPVREGGER